jgi:hypothetical protein
MALDLYLCNLTSMAFIKDPLNTDIESYIPLSCVHRTLHKVVGSHVDWSVQLWGQETLKIPLIHQPQSPRPSRGTINYGIIHGVTPEDFGIFTRLKSRFVPEPIDTRLWRSRGSFFCPTLLTPGNIKTAASLFVFVRGIFYPFIILLRIYNVFTTATFELGRQPARSSWLRSPEDPGKEP